MATSRIICPHCVDLIFRFKLLKWWAQSFLPGVPLVVAGFRDHDGVVVSVEDYPVSKMSHLTKVRLFAVAKFANVPLFVTCCSHGQTEPNCWKPTVCMNFCCDFLSFVKQVVTEDNPR